MTLLLEEQTNLNIKRVNQYHEFHFGDSSIYDKPFDILEWP